MVEHVLPQILFLLGGAVAAVVLFQRLRIPSSLSYLFVGVLLGPHTAGPVLDIQPVQAAAEFGIVFLLFTIGLSFSLPQLAALRQLVFGLGTAQVVLTTAVVAVLAWPLGLPPAEAFVVGAVFAQSSTIVITRQLADQGEAQSRPGRLAVSLSVFQDVTAVPLMVAIPVLGVTAAGAHGLTFALAEALAKAALAFALVFLIGRWAFRPLFHLVARERSAELFTLTVLFVSLTAAWVSDALGLSLAFGAFLAGMMLGETEFRHQVESAIRPFRDVLLGLFFIGVGMLFDPGVLPQLWHWALLGAIGLLSIKAVLVAQTARFAGLDAATAWRTGWMLAVGGEFGFALLAIALGAGAIREDISQIALNAVLFSMVAAPWLIRYNHALARMLSPRIPPAEPPPAPTPEAIGHPHDHVIVCGYGRIGQSVARLLDQERIPYLALDLNADRARQAHTAGEPVFYGDSSEPNVLEAVGLAEARLVVVTHDDVPAALKLLHFIRTVRPELPVMVRTHDEKHTETLRAAGATEVVPETFEASLMIAASALLHLNVPGARVMQRIQEQRHQSYRLLRELFQGDTLLSEPWQAPEADRLRPVVLPAAAAVAGRALHELELDGVVVTALLRGGQRQLHPPADARLQAGDVVVLYGSPVDLDRAERVLLS